VPRLATGTTTARRGCSSNTVTLSCRATHRDRERARPRVRPLSNREVYMFARSFPMSPLGTLLDALITRALHEDLDGGDPTTEATVGEDARAVGKAFARSAMVVCGVDVFARVFHLVDPGVRVEALHLDGARVAAGDAILVVEGSARSLLMGERTALNLLQRMTGIATLSRRFADQVPPGSALRVTDTRKTTPGLRALERYAVRTGGAFNHRDQLGSAILIKDNHIALAGGIAPAVESARRRAPHTSRIEVEVESLDALDEALAAGAEVVMLDNFTDELVAEGVRRAKGRALVEVSGGVTLERISTLARLGVDVVSVGALTHSAPAADISLELGALGAPGAE
jgi:nicotinate-nucleotide pyrophosphorylase (carboxylating)